MSLVKGIYDITPATGGGYYIIDEMSYLTKINEEGQIIFTEQIQSNQAVIELTMVIWSLAVETRIFDGGYGGTATITRLSFPQHNNYNFRANVKARPQSVSLRSIPYRQYTTFD